MKKRNKSLFLLFMLVLTFILPLSSVKADGLNDALLNPSFVTGKSGSSSNTKSKSESETKSKTTVNITPPLADNLTHFSPDDPNSPSGVMTKKNRDNMSLYTSYMVTGDNPLTAGWKGSLHAVGVQMPFGIAKGEYTLTKTINTTLSNNTILTDKAGAQFASSKKIYGKLMGAGFGYIAVLGIILTLIRGIVKGRVPQTFLSIVMILSVNLIFFNAGSQLLTKANSAITLTRDAIVKEIAGEDKTDLQNIMVTQPFLYLNFDDVTIGDRGVSNITQTNIDRLLNTKGDDEAVETVQKDLKLDHMTYSTIGSKVSTAWSAMFSNFVYMIIFSFLSIISFVFQLIALLLIDFSWIPAILSFYPKFNTAMLNFIKKVMQLAVVGIVATAGSAMVILFNSVVTAALKTSGITEYGTQTWLKIAIILAIYLFRNQLGGLIQRGEFQAKQLVGNIQSRVQRTGSNAFNNVKQGAVAGLTAGAVGAGLLKDKAQLSTFGNSAGIAQNLSAMRKDRKLKSLARKSADKSRSPEQREKALRKGQKLADKKDTKLDKLNNQRPKSNDSVNKKGSVVPSQSNNLLKADPQQAFMPYSLKKKEQKKAVLEQHRKGYDELKEEEKKKYYQENREERQKAIGEKTKLTSELAKNQEKPFVNTPKYGRTKNTPKSERKRKRKAFVNTKLQADDELIRRQYEERTSGITRY
jgi:Uncharacterized protein conserved in bacteria with the myosin-like domain